MNVARKARSATRRARWGLLKALAPRRTVQARGLRFELQCDNWITQFRADSLATKEPETLDWIDAHVGDHDVLFDIGGNIGVFAVYAALRHPDVSVVVFEPEYGNLHLLRDNVAANGLAGRVQIYSIAISDRTGVTRLHVQDLTPGAALHTESTGVPALTESGERVVFSEGTWAMTLDDFCGQAGLWPTAVKIDVDGGEGRVLHGARQALSRRSLHSIIVEAGASGLQPDAERLLTDVGLQRVALPQPSEAGMEVWAR